jgi:hypothetical protein
MAFKLSGDNYQHSDLSLWQREIKRDFPLCFVMLEFAVGERSIPGCGSYLAHGFPFPDWAEGGFWFSKSPMGKLRTSS